MSDRLSLSDLGRLPAAGAGFRARPLEATAPTPRGASDAAPVHFAPGRPAGAAPTAGIPDPQDDPLRAAWSDGFAAGRAVTPDQDVLHALSTQFARLGARVDAALADRLRETVLALCRQLLSDAAFDPAELERRVAVALDRLGEVAAVACRCHPDAAETARALLPDGVRIAADAALAPNAFVLDTAHGGVSDGPEEWGRALAAALAEC